MAGMTAPVLFLVPGRGGSVRVTGKNLRTVAGIPLVGRAVRSARIAARSIPGGPHRVVCSTDDPQIAAAAAAWGAEVPFQRPAALSGPEASSVDVALHALAELGARGATFRAIVLVQPTSPLLEPDDLVRAVARFDELGRPVVGMARSHPATWHLRAGASGRDEIVPTAGDPAAWLLTGGVYVIDPPRLQAARTFLEAGVAVGVEIDPRRAVDVDDELDLVVAEAIAQARPVRTLDLAGCRIGEAGTFVIAEAGVNHNGDVQLAHRLVDAAADARADAVKFQTFDPEALAAVGAPMAAYQRAAGEHGADQREMLARLALPAEAWAGLQAHAHDRGLVFISTPFDLGSAILLDALDVPVFKVGSGELTNLPFLAQLAAFGRPMLVSTGMADMREVAEAVDTIGAAGDPAIALLHCVSSYPASPADANLAAIATLRAAFAVPAGWSDHTPGIELSIAAAALGASIIEKHITLDRSLPGPDHAASLEPDAFRSLTDGVQTAAAARGDGVKRPVEAELDVARVARRSLHWRRDLDAGTTIGREDLLVLRPASGLAPGRLGDLVGRRTAHAVRAGTPCVNDDLEDDG